MTVGKAVFASIGVLLLAGAGRWLATGSWRPALSQLRRESRSGARGQATRGSSTNGRVEPRPLTNNSEPVTRTIGFDGGVVRRESGAIDPHLRTTSGRVEKAVR